MKETIKETLCNLPHMFVVGDVCNLSSKVLLSWDFVQCISRSWQFSLTISVFLCMYSTARADTTEFVEYDLDNDDDDWLVMYNKEETILSPERYAF